MQPPVLFRWLGVAGIELQFAGQVLLIDPFLTRPPWWRLFSRVESDHVLVAQHVGRCDHILVTHAHWDHLMDVPDVARNTGATVWGSANTCQLLSIYGIPGDQLCEVRAGDCLPLGRFQVEVLPAQHMWVPVLGTGPLPARLRLPLRPIDWRMDHCFAFLIEVGGLRLLDWSGVRSEPATRADVLFVRPGEKWALYAALLRRVQPRLVIPVHWDDFVRPLSKPIRPFLQPPRLALPPLRRVNLDEFKRRVESWAPGTVVLVPEVFRAHDLRSA